MEVHDAAGARLPDAVGAAQLAIAVSLLVLGLSQAPDRGWDVRVYGSFAAAVALVAAFLWRSARHPAPIVELSMFRVPSFTHAMVVTVVFWAGFAALLLGNALFLTGACRGQVNVSPAKRV